MDKTTGMKPVGQYKVILWEALADIKGGQKVALDIAACLKDKFHFEFIVPGEGQISPELHKMNIDIHYIQTGTYHLWEKRMTDFLKFLWFTPVTLWKSYKIVRCSDLIYANSTRIFIWSAVTGYFAGVPVIWHLHNLLIDKKARFLVELFGRMASVKKIIAVSYAAKNQFRSLRDKTEVVYNGIDESRFNPRQTSNELKAGNITLGIIADLIPLKGHETLIKAIETLRGRLTVNLLIIGAPRKGYEYYEDALKELVMSLRLNKNVIFMGYRTDIPELLSGLDLLIIPSSSSFEACPMAALEAFACGVPVIGSNLGGTAELIEEGHTGYLFLAGDENDLANKILLIAHNPALYQKMKKQCRTTVSTRFSLNKAAAHIESIINTVLCDDNLNK
jgi:glycosyltransferase involved in cell wall biosynthesis